MYDDYLRFNLLMTSKFFAGLVMMPSVIHAYIQVGHFLMLIMSTSWVYSTFFFLALCAVLGPQGHDGDVIRCWKMGQNRVRPLNDGCIDKKVESNELPIVTDKGNQRTWLRQMCYFSCSYFLAIIALLCHNAFVVISKVGTRRGEMHGWDGQSTTMWWRHMNKAKINFGRHASQWLYIVFNDTPRSFSRT